MANNPRAMDNSGTLGPSVPALVDRNLWAPSWIPANGFEWIRGSADKPGPFLVRRQGEHVQARMPPDLHLTFADLRPEQDAIMGFAQRHGCLRIAGEEHFHPNGGNDWSEGEQLGEWQLEITRFRAVRDLWYASKCGTSFARRQLATVPQRRPNEPWILVVPPERGLKAIDRAREIAIATVNAGLTPGFEAGFNNARDCRFPGCGGGGTRQWHDYTRPFVRESVHGALDLVIVPRNLIKALWLQAAAMVTGQRIVKKCEAPDCGRYMDVTSSARPSARRMHPWCSERLRKREYRKNLRIRQGGENEK